MLAIQPKILKNFVLYVPGSTAGRCDEVQLPNLELQTESHRAGGMDAPIKHDLGMNEIDLTFTMSEYDPNVLGLFGVKDQNSTRLIFRGHADDNAGGSQAVVVIVNGQLQAVNPDGVRAGNRAGVQFRVNCTYYKLTVAGRDVHEIDIPNMKRIINGSDQLATMRGNLGAG